MRDDHADSNGLPQNRASGNFAGSSESKNHYQLKAVDAASSPHLFHIIKIDDRTVLGSGSSLNDPEIVSLCNRLREANIGFAISPILYADDLETVRQLSQSANPPTAISLDDAARVLVESSEESRSLDTVWQDS